MLYIEANEEQRWIDTIAWLIVGELNISTNVEENNNQYRTFWRTGQSKSRGRPSKPLAVIYLIRSNFI